MQATETSSPETTAFALEAHGLSRSFGTIRALDSFEASLPWGQVIALVGPNGAGKTTLLLVLAGLLAPDRGSARVAGFDPVAHPYAVHRAVGWMPDFFGVYDHLSPREYLELFAHTYRLPTHAHARAAELLDLVGLASMADVPVHTLSRGQKQKLGFARTLIHGPRVLLLDEPASGLDPRARIELRDLVRRQADAGVAVLISSHILAELEEMADIVVFMERGRCTGIYPWNELPRGAGLRLWRVRALDHEGLLAALSEIGLDAEPMRGRGVTVRLASDEEAADLCADLVARGVRVVELAPQAGGLEGAFMSMGESLG